MEQNPNERYASALEFREALRQVGRTDEISEIEFVAHAAPIESTIVEIAETTFFKPSPGEATNRKLGPHAIAALFVIMIAAFGVFCRYYPWKLPPVQGQVQTTVKACPVDHDAMTDKRTARGRNQKTAPRG